MKKRSNSSCGMQSNGSMLFVRREDGSTLTIDAPEQHNFSVGHLLRLISVCQPRPVCVIPCWSIERHALSCAP
jgi:hypothetical protein